MADTLQGGIAARTMLFGLYVPRATATLPQSAAAAIYTVAGGDVILTWISGTVTTLLGAVGNMKLVAHADAADTDMCAVVAAGTSAVGTIFTITGTPGDAMLAEIGAARGISFYGLVVHTGTINLSLSLSSTGSVKWDLLYVPLTQGATVTAA